MNKPEEPPAAKVSWDAVRALAIAVGVREAARQLGVSEEATMKRSQREGWLRDTNGARAYAESAALRKSSAPVVRNGPHMPLNPAQLMAQELLSLGGKSRLGFAKASAEVATFVATRDPEENLADAQNVKAAAQTANMVFGWQDQQPNVKIRLDVLNAPAEAPIIDIEADVQTSESDWGAESYDLDDF